MVVVASGRARAELRRREREISEIRAGMAHRERPCIRPPRARAHTITAAHSHDRRAGLSVALYKDFITGGDPRAVANIYDYLRPEDTGKGVIYRGADRSIGRSTVR